MSSTKFRASNEKVFTIRDSASASKAQSTHISRMITVNEALGHLTRSIADISSYITPVLSTTGSYALPPYINLRSIPSVKFGDYLKQTSHVLNRDAIDDNTLDILGNIVNEYAYITDDSDKSYNTYLALMSLVADTCALDSQDLQPRFKEALYQRPHFCVEYAAAFTTDRQRRLIILSSSVHVDDARNDNAILRSELLATLYTVREALHSFSYDVQLDPQKIFVRILHVSIN